MNTSSSSTPHQPYDPLYLAFAGYVKTAMEARKGYPQLARVYISLARAARQLLSNAVKSGKAEYRINGVAMRLEPVDLAISHRQFMVGIQKGLTSFRGRIPSVRADNSKACQEITVTKRRGLVEFGHGCSGT